MNLKNRREEELRLGVGKSCELRSRMTLQRMQRLYHYLESISSCSFATSPPFISKVVAALRLVLKLLVSGMKERKSILHVESGLSPNIIRSSNSFLLNNVEVGKMLSAH
jgi:hypothetical protein